MLISTTRAYTGRIINVDHDSVRFPNGSTGILEMVRHPGAAAVVPMLGNLEDPDPRVLLIRQFRHAADDAIWEVPAGTLNRGEEPEACAYRELEEEAGRRAGALRHLATIFTTPGFTDERIHLFLATRLEPGREQPEHDEFITVHELAWSDVGRMVQAGEIVDAKTLCALYRVQILRQSSGAAGWR
jgi:ADP-ribose pyrophosphatase